MGTPVVVREHSHDSCGIWGHKESCSPCKAEKSRRTRGMFGVIACIPKYCYVWLNPAFPDTGEHLHIHWKQWMLFTFPCVPGFHFYLSSQVFSLLLLWFSPYLRLKLASPDSRTAENTDSLRYFFIWLLGISQWWQNIFTSFWNMTWSYAFKWILSILADGANCAQFCEWNWTRKTARIIKFPKTMDNQGLSCSLMELTRTQCGL